MLYLVLLVSPQPLFVFGSTHPSNSSPRSVVGNPVFIANEHLGELNDLDIEQGISRQMAAADRHPDTPTQEMNVSAFGLS